jgi:hypothetical protein
MTLISSASILWDETAFDFAVEYGTVIVVFNVINLAVLSGRRRITLHFSAR